MPTPPPSFPPFRGLYLITPDDADTGRLLARVAPLLPHAACLQYRNKASDSGTTDYD